MSRALFRTSISIAAIEALESRLVLATTSPYVPPHSGRANIDLDASWKFNKSDVAGASASIFDDSSWSNVNLPHNWNSQDGQDGGNDYYQGVGWYRRHYTISSTYAGKQIFLKFDGALLNTSVYLNGTFVGSHKGGYSAFTFNLNPYVKIGQDNVIAVKVSNANDPNIAPYFSVHAPDWTKFGGLYRDVHLLVTNTLQVNPLNLGSPGIFIKQSGVSAASAKVSITAEVRNGTGLTRSATLKTVIVDKTGSIVKSMTSTPFTVAGNSVVKATLSATISNPHLWNGVLDPYLYKVYTQVSEGSTTTDVVAQFIGLRFYKVDANQGFLLNGKPYDLHGVAYHEDRLDEGSATTSAERAQDISLIKEIGATTVRMAHYQHAADEYDLLDRAGIIVWNEIPLDANFNTSSDFTSNLIRQLKETIRQEYNHPSIVFMGIGNELPATTDALNLVSNLKMISKAENPGLITTIASNLFVDSDVLKFPADLDAFNKYYGWYTKNLSDFKPWLDAVHKNNPNTPIGLAEYGASGNIDQHEANPPKPADTGGPYQPEEYENRLHETYWSALRTRPWVWGKWVWEMFDSASDWRFQGRVIKGLVTYDRAVKKDAFYFYKANWSSSPVMYITSRRWTNRPSATNDVKVYSNCDSVTLSVNGQTIGTLVPGSTKIAKWTGIVLQPGANLIRITGQRNGLTYTDSVTWNYTGSAAMSLRAQPAGSVFSQEKIRKEPLADVLV